MKISVSYAHPERPAWLRLEVAEGCTIAAAIERSGILGRYPCIDLGRNKVGVFGKIHPLDTVLKEGDRVEIYMPIIVDPKTVPTRKKSAAKTASAPSAEES